MLWETNLKDLLGPGSEGLLLATELITLPHAEDAFAPQLLEQCVHGVGKGTEVRVGPRAKAKHREPSEMQSHGEDRQARDTAL